MPRATYTFYIDANARAALTAVKERDGISESEQIRRGIELWLKSKGVRLKKPQRASVPAGSRSSTRRQK